MPKKKKVKSFDVVAAVKAAARAKIGAVPPTRKQEGTRKRKKKQEKHKPTLSRLLGDDGS